MAAAARQARMILMAYAASMARSNKYQRRQHGVIIIGIESSGAKKAKNSMKKKHHHEKHQAALTGSGDNEMTSKAKIMAKVAWRSIAGRSSIGKGGGYHHAFSGLARKSATGAAGVYGIIHRQAKTQMAAAAKAAIAWQRGGTRGGGIMARREKKKKKNISDWQRNIMAWRKRYQQNKKMAP